MVKRVDETKQDSTRKHKTRQTQDKKTQQQYFLIAFRHPRIPNRRFRFFVAASGCLVLSGPVILPFR
jgi:hypothetical protein